MRRSIITSSFSLNQMTDSESELNIFSPPSELSYAHPISVNHNRRLIIEIIDNMFTNYKGNVDVSSSQCSSLRIHSSEYSYDKRLQYWKNMLHERQLLDKKIRQKIHKKPYEILYNRLTTLDERDKSTVKRVIDYADRLVPDRLAYLEPSVLKEKCNKYTCLPIPELKETLPLPERTKLPDFEIVGLPNISKVEILGKTKYQGEIKPYSWLKSQILGKHIEEKSRDIERVIEYYPDIDNLQIIGENALPNKLIKHDSDIQVLKIDEITRISEDSIDELQLCTTGMKSVDTIESIEYGVNINENVFIMRTKRSSKNVNVEVTFITTPFCKKVKKVLYIKNIGMKVLNFEWSHRSFYDKESTLLKSYDNEFLFDIKPFRLYTNEIKEIHVIYQPRRVDTVKSKWILKVEPQFFCRKLDGVVLQLTGICNAPPEYEDKIKKVMNEIIGKSNKQMMNKLTGGLAGIVPLMQPYEVICPYKRTLKDIEIFEQLNPGYVCERYHDLELMRDIYNRAKKPREPEWNLKIDSIKCMILRIPNPNNRALFINELCSILEPIKGKRIDLETRINTDPERERNKLLYVRGIICTSIDEWSEMTLTIEEAHLNTAIPAFFTEVRQYFENEINEQEIEENTSEKNAEDSENYPFPTLENENIVREFVLTKRVRCLKAFRDCLYMQTYTIMCNFVEDIVNIIEGAEIV